MIKNISYNLSHNLFYVWLSFIAFPALLIVVTGVYYNYIEKLKELNAAIVRESSVVKIGKISIKSSLNGVKEDLFFLSQMNDFKMFVNTNAAPYLQKISLDYKLFMNSRHIYDQIRWIDETGLERLRVEYDNISHLSTMNDDLQNKAHRYYFISAMKLPKNSIYISPFDLNIEHKAIELPYKPMLRIAREVYDKEGVKRGIFILNYLGSDLLKNFEDSTAFSKAEVMLLNKDAYWLKGLKADEWAFMFHKKRETLAQRNPMVWKKISQQERGEFEDGNGLWSFETVHHFNDIKKNVLYKIVTFIPNEKIYDISNRKFYYMLFVMFLLMLIVGIASWILTYLYQNKEVLLRELEKFSLAVEQIDDIISIVDTSGKIIYVNNAFCRETGYTKEELIGRKSNILKSLKHDSAFYKELWETIQRGEVYRNTIINKKKNGNLYYEKKTISPLKEEDGTIRCFVSTGQDVTKDVEMQKKISKLATSDQLTGIYNRHKFLELYEIEDERASRLHSPYSMILIDIDDFKSINDTYGHDIGDEVLKEVASILQNKIRKIDILARWGGEEFLILNSNTNENSIQTIAEKLRVAIASRNFAVVKKITISVGISTFKDKDSFNSIFKRLDLSVYAAKEYGKNRVGPLL